MFPGGRPLIAICGQMTQSFEKPTSKDLYYIQTYTQVGFSKYLVLCPQIVIIDHPPGNMPIRRQTEVGWMCMQATPCSPVETRQCTACAPWSVPSVCCTFSGRWINHPHRRVER